MFEHKLLLIGICYQRNFPIILVHMVLTGSNVRKKKSVKSMAWNVRIDGEIKHEIVWIIWESKPNTAKKHDIAFAGIVKMC